MEKKAKYVDLSDVNWIDILFLVLFLGLVVVQIEKMGILKTIKMLLFPLN